MNSARLTDRGLENDRRWMLIDANNRFISQRENAQMALFKTGLECDAIKVTHVTDNSFIHIPFTYFDEDTVEVTIWDDICTGHYVSTHADTWFSQRLGINCRLVYMAEKTHRLTDPRYSIQGSITSFSDAYPLLLIGQASLDDLNSRLTKPVPMNRFRPNIVFTGAAPYSEDTMQHIIVNGIDLYGVKLCARCVMTTIDQVTTKKSKEPLKTLAGYRRKGDKTLFGQNLTNTGEGIINIGDQLQVISLQTDDRFMVV